MARERYELVPSRYIDDQRILKSDWTRETLGHTHQRLIALEATFPLIIISMLKSKISIGYFQILLIKKFYNLIGQEAQLATPNHEW